MSRRTAFTLVELLVVIAIVGVLLALLLPAIQAVREAARRAQCTGNLKHLGLAIQSHHSATGALPAGNYTKTLGVCPGRPAPGVEAPSEDRENWLISLLPYLEQPALYEAYVFREPNESPQNRQVRESFVSTYVCPSDIAADTLTVPAMGPASADALNAPYMPGSYRAVAGRSDGYVFLDSGEFNEFPRSWRGAIHTIGVLGFRRERLRDILDGTSQTLLVGESTTRTSPEYRTLWAYSYAFYSLSSVTPQERTLCGDYDRCTSTGGNGYSRPCRRGWGSPHRGLINFAFCDGSVRFLPASIDLELLAGLATIDGGEVVAAPD